MNVLRCQVKLSKVVQVDIPEDKLGDQLPETLAQLTARSQYGYDYSTEVLQIERSHVEDAPNKRVQADVCWACGKPWSEHRTNRVGHAVCP